MTNHEEEIQQKSTWEEYVSGALRLSRAELGILFALARVNFNGNLSKQFQHYYDLYSKDQSSLVKHQRPIFDTILSNHSAYVSLAANLKKSQKFAFLPKIDDLIRKVACYQAVFENEMLPSPEDFSRFKDAVVRLGILEEYDDFVIVYPSCQSADARDQASMKKGEARAGEVFWKKHEEIYFGVLRKLIINHFGTIGTERPVVQLSDLLLLIIFVLATVVPSINAREYTAVANAVKSLHDMTLSTITELEETMTAAPSGERINRVRRSVDLIKANLYELSKKLNSEDRINIRAIGGIQVVLTDSLKAFVSRQSTTPPYFPVHKAAQGFAEIFSKRTLQEQLPLVMSDTHRLNNHALIYTPFVISYILSGSISCLMLPEPDKLSFALRFFSTKTGPYRDDIKFSLGGTKTVVPYSENVVSNNRRSKDSLITRKPEEVMSPFDIRVDNKDGILLLNVINKGHSLVYVHLFTPGDFIPGEFSDGQSANALWKQIETDSPLLVPSQEARKKVDDLIALTQDPVVPEAVSAVVVVPAAGSDLTSQHPWRRKLEPSKLECNSFGFAGSKITQPVRVPPPIVDVKQESPVRVTYDAQREELCSVILLNDLLRNIAKKNNKNITNKELGSLFERIQARKKLEELYPALCPKSKTDYLLKTPPE